MGDTGMDGMLPQDHEDQMQLGIRIITTAFQKKMNSLEQEIRSLRMTSEEQRERVSALHKKGSSLEVELVESHQRSKQLSDENKELFKTVGQLRKQIGKLEVLKQAVTSHIQDHQAQEVEDGSTRYMSEEYLRNQTPATAALMGYPAGRDSPARRQQQPSPLDTTQYVPGRSYDPPPASANSALDSSTGAASESPLSSGRAFFTRARSRLPKETFNQFLSSIKSLNSQRQTREQTLEEARRIFGAEHQDLYLDFEKILDRHGM